MATKSAVAKEDPTRRSLKLFLRQSSAVSVPMARVSVPVSFRADQVVLGIRRGRRKGPNSLAAHAVSDRSWQDEGGKTVGTQINSASPLCCRHPHVVGGYRSSAAMPSAGSRDPFARTKDAPTEIAANGNASSALNVRVGATPCSDNTSGFRAMVMRSSLASTVSSLTSPISASRPHLRAVQHTPARDLRRQDRIRAISRLETVLRQRRTW